MKLPQLEQPDAAQAQSAGGTRPGAPVTKPLRKKVLLPVLACVLLGAVALYAVRRSQPAPAAGSAYTTAAVERRDITAQITGSGSLEAANAYSVTTLVEGSILTAGFEEGDQVEEGTVLYTLDASDLASTLEQAQLSLDQARRSYDSRLRALEKLSVTAPRAGRILSMEVEAGDVVSAGQRLATLRNADTMTLEVPFLSEEAAGFYVGQSASVTLERTFETLEGSVSRIDQADTALEGGRLVRYVTVQVANPGALSAEQTGSASVGGCSSAGSASFAYAAEETITAEISGEVAAVQAPEGSWVDKGSVILTLTSDNLTSEVQNAADALRNAELSLERRARPARRARSCAPSTTCPI